MALVKGICKNFGECDLADNKEIQEVDKTNFVCEECGKPLHPVDGGIDRNKTPSSGLNMKLIGIIAAVLIVLAGAGWVGYSLLGGSKIDKVQLDKNAMSLTVGQKDIIKPTLLDKNGKIIKDVNVVYKWIIADEQVASVTQRGEVTALTKGETSITVKVKGDEKLFAICQIKVNAPDISQPPIGKPSEGKTKQQGDPNPQTRQMPKVSWGKYEGPVNGLGGTIKVTRAYSLDLHDDGEPLQLSPGDEIQQTKFTNGELRGGVWVHDGSRRSFTI